eukprot:3066987-Pleurochrysis_carterae.AAC.2
MAKMRQTLDALTRRVGVTDSVAPADSKQSARSNGAAGWTDNAGKTADAEDSRKSSGVRTPKSVRFVTERVDETEPATTAGLSRVLSQSRPSPGQNTTSAASLPATTSASTSETNLKPSRRTAGTYSDSFAPSAEEPARRAESSCDARDNGGSESGTQDGRGGNGDGRRASSAALARARAARGVALSELIIDEAQHDGRTAAQIDGQDAGETRVPVTSPARVGVEPRSPELRSSARRARRMRTQPTDGDVAADAVGNLGQTRL